jgi:hypothetical protein
LELGLDVAGATVAMDARGGQAVKARIQIASRAPHGLTSVFDLRRRIIL